MGIECSQQDIGITEHRININRYWLVLRFLIAFILLVAAGLKAYQLATTPSLGEGLLHARWFNIFVVEFELFFGIWLIFGLLPRLTWLVTTGLFATFSLVTFYEAVTGEISCNCFGNITVNPWITMTFDLIITGLLMIFLPKKPFFVKKMFLGELTGLKQKVKMIAVVGIWLVMAIPITFAMLSVKFVTLTEESHLSENEKSVLLEPSKWIGKKFPLLQFLEDSDIDKILTSNQNIVLFRFDCDECKQMIEKIQDKDHYVFIAIPSEKNNEVLFSLPEYLTLPDNYEWWVETPVVFALENGTVKKVFNMIE